MKTTTLQLLPTTNIGIPSGNYDGSSQEWAGVAQKAANYYSGFGGLQTVAFFLNGFQGHITIEASLDTVPDSNATWFTVQDLDYITSPVTQNFSRNIPGNFAWIRAKVDNFIDGTITKVTLSY
jgi:hypothetical protein